MRSSCKRAGGFAAFLWLPLFLTCGSLAGQDISTITAAEVELQEISATTTQDTACNTDATTTDEFAGSGAAATGINESTPAVNPFDELPQIELVALKDMAGARGWWYAWLAGYSAATAGQAAVFFSSDDKGLRQDMVLGAATTFLGAMNQLITPVEPRRRDYPSYREYLSGEKSMSSDQAAELLKNLAAWEKEGRSWKTHALAGVVNLGSGLITWLGFKRTFMDGLENFAINTIITEAQIWTQPIRAVKDYEKYFQQNGSGTETLHSGIDGEWTWSIFPGGFYIRYVF